MGIFIRLSEDISCDYICKQIQKAINKSNKEDLIDCILHIDVKKIKDSQASLPKLLENRVKDTQS